jgi:hypothetical protein
LRDSSTFNVHEVIAGFAARPSETPSRPNGPGIVEITPEYKDRNLLSIIAELSALKPDWAKQGRASSVSLGGRPGNASEKPVRVGEDQLRKAMLALLSPEWLIAFKQPEYSTFKQRFMEAFPVGEIGKFPFPGLDCFDC